MFHLSSVNTLKGNGWVYRRRMFNFIRKCHTAFQNACAILNSHQHRKVLVASFLPTLGMIGIFAFLALHQFFIFDFFIPSIFYFYNKLSLKYLTSRNSNKVIIASASKVLTYLISPLNAMGRWRQYLPQRAVVRIKWDDASRASGLVSAT